MTREEITGYLRTETGEEYHARHGREEIREGIAERIYRWYFRNSDLNDFGVWTEVSGATRGMVLAITDIVLEYESSQGVVIKVDSCVCEMCRGNPSASQCQTVYKVESLIEGK